MVKRLNLMLLRVKREMKLLMLQGQMDQMSKVVNMLQTGGGTGEVDGIHVIVEAAVAVEPDRIWMIVHKNL